jgi:hypothetical protein
VSTLLEVVEAMIDALEPLTGEVDGLQLSPYMLANATPPAIDIYPATPFQTGSGFGNDAQVFFTVRARTTTADHVAGQRILYRLLDKQDPASVQMALETDQTLDGVVQSLAVVDESVTGFTEYLDDAQTGSRLIGCEWRVGVIA